MVGDLGGTQTLELSPEHAARLRQLLDDMDASDALANLINDPDPNPDNDQDEGDSDDQEPNPATDEQYAMLLARQDASDQRIIELTQQLRTTAVRAELDTLARQGLAPAIIKAAQPLLGVPTGAVELSQPDGTRVDPAEVCRDVLRTVLELSQSGQAVVELDAETGFAVTDNDPEQAKRDAMLAEMDRLYGH